MSSHLLPPEMQQEPEPKTIVERFQQTSNQLLNVERALAGYNCVSELLSQLEGESSSRRRIPPIFNYKASVDGHKMTDVCLDLRRMDEKTQHTVLSHIAHLHANELHQALVTMQRNVNAMVSEVEAALGSPATAALAANPGQPAQPQGAVVSGQDDGVQVSLET